MLDVVRKNERTAKGITDYFQDPYESLNPRMTVSQAIQAPLIIQKIYKALTGWGWRRKPMK